MSDKDDRIELRSLTGPAARVDAYREEMWAVISDSWSEQVARRRRVRQAGVWGAVGLGLAAMLVVGIVVGRWSAGGEGREPAEPPILADGGTVERPLAMPYRIAVGEHFRDAETLLLLFESSDETDTEIAGLARELAATSRMLMESDAGRDAEVRSILLDLELLLVQIARLADSDDPAEAGIVRDGIVETEALSRMRRVLAQEAVGI